MTLALGAPAPLFSAPSPVNPKFALGSLGGRYVLLLFLPAPGPDREAALQAVRDHAEAFRNDYLVCFGVLPDAGSYADARNEPPFHWFSDKGGELRRLYQLEGENGQLIPTCVLIDPTLRVMGIAPLAHAATVVARAAALGDPERHAGVPMQAPVLIVPRIFELDLCQRLIAHYDAIGGSPSGTMIERGGKTVGVLSSFKSRRDVSLADETLIAETRTRIARRLLPEIEKAFQFKVTRMERYIVACYDAAEGGHFNAHRDNTTAGTAHRQFAVSINLNAEDFVGGDLRFPEFGRRTYRPPTGGAVVFSCSLLHEATPVTEGVRYAFLPFLYDEAAAKIRAANLHLLETEAGSGPRVEP
jgi:peroxiredoxin/predicted 2-oxoglutarate/Fe(II)-dependent dioxygenase YbiX